MFDFLVQNISCGCHTIRIWLTRNVDRVYLAAWDNIFLSGQRVMGVNTPQLVFIPWVEDLTQSKKIALLALFSLAKGLRLIFDLQRVISKLDYPRPSALYLMSVNPTAGGRLLPEQGQRFLCLHWPASYSITEMSSSLAVCIDSIIPSLWNIEHRGLQNV